MKKSTIAKRILICLILAAVIGSIIYVVFTKNRVNLYDDNRITGNTSGNLLNGGLFCENEGKIYFANPYDGNRLYCMNNDLTSIKKLFDDRVSYINSAEKYIFYTRRNDQLENDADALLSLSTTGFSGLIHLDMELAGCMMTLHKLYVFMVIIFTTSTMTRKKALNFL